MVICDAAVESLQIERCKRQNYLHKTLEDVAAGTFLILEAFLRTVVAHNMSYVPWWIFFKKKLYPTMFFHTTCGNVMTCV